mmetsp:Transcript_4328/g.4891  ORF Transcript_4328/g.4891 Transcript_4328/m.4891 type:complete len:82 (+) Transcript_4328:45-290(+)
MLLSIIVKQKVPTNGKMNFNKISTTTLFHHRLIQNRHNFLLVSDLEYLYPTIGKNRNGYPFYSFSVNMLYQSYWKWKYRHS